MYSANNTACVNFIPKHKTVSRGAVDRRKFITLEQHLTFYSHPLQMH